MSHASGLSCDHAAASARIGNVTLLMIYIGRNMQQEYRMILKSHACTAAVFSELDKKIDVS
jgi:hypothetical protein